MKTVITALLLIGLCGCNADQDRDRDHRYESPWKQTGPVLVIGSYLYNIDFERTDGNVVTIRLCSEEPNWSMKVGMTVDIKWRTVNRYIGSDTPCDQMDGYRIIKDVPKELM